MTALVKCRHCRNIISADAPVCIRCGGTVEQTERSCSGCGEAAKASATYCWRCGFALDSTATEEVPPTAVPSDPPPVQAIQLSRRTKIVSIIVVIVLALLGAGAVVVQKTLYTPEAAVQGYFDALAAKDGEKALRYLARGGEILNLREGYVPPTGLQYRHDIVTPDVNGAKHLAIRYRIGDREHSSDVVLRPSETRSFGLFRGWRLSDPPGPLDVVAPAKMDVRIDGVVVPGSRERTGANVRVTVFPGRHVVDLVDNPLWESKPVQVDVEVQGAHVELNPRAKASAVQAVQTQVKDYLDRCAAGSGVQSCPRDMSSYYWLSKVVWRIDTYPTIELVAGNNGQVVVRTVTVGKATGTGDSFGKRYDVGVDLSVDGAVVLDQGKIVFTTGP